jgi:hypothetical protein
VPRYQHPRRRPYRGTFDVGHERARQHIEDARRLSEDLGGTDEDVKQYFFSLPRADLRKILDSYEREYGRSACEYAENTIDHWRSRSVTMSGTVASRLFKLLPPLMPLQTKYDLISNLWNQLGPRSKRILRVGLKVELEEIVKVVAKHIDDMVVEYRIPLNLEKRFEWLAAGDSQVKQDLLNYLRQKEKSIAVEGARTQLPILLAHLRDERGRHTWRLAQILKIGNHELELMLDRSAPGISVVDPTLLARLPTMTKGNWAWLWWFIAAAGILFFLMRR